MVKRDAIRFLKPEYFEQHDALKLAKSLIGCSLHSFVDGVHTAGRITETEAYHQQERGCHAYGGKKTPRTACMFEPGGIAYIYLCYGMHHLFNVVCGPPESAQAVLIRAIEPTIGIENMLERRKQTTISPILTAGPARLTQALGIHTTQSATALNGQLFGISAPKIPIADKQLHTTSRIGIEYAKEDAKLPWRVYLKDSKWISHP